MTGEWDNEEFCAILLLNPVPYLSSVGWWTNVILRVNGVNEPGTSSPEIINTGALTFCHSSRLNGCAPETILTNVGVLD